MEYRISDRHPLSENFDFDSFLESNLQTIEQLIQDAESVIDLTGLSGNLDQSIAIASVVGAAVLSDMNSISKSDLPLPVPSANADFEERFIDFVSNLVTYVLMEKCVDQGLLRRSDNGYELADNAD